MYRCIKVECLDNNFILGSNAQGNYIYQFGSRLVECPQFHILLKVAFEAMDELRKDYKKTLPKNTPKQEYGLIHFNIDLVRNLDNEVTAIEERETTRELQVYKGYRKFKVELWTQIIKHIVRKTQQPGDIMLIHTMEFGYD